MYRAELSLSYLPGLRSGVRSAAGCRWLDRAGPDGHRRDQASSARRISLAPVLLKTLVGQRGVAATWCWEAAAVALILVPLALLMPGRIPPARADTAPRRNRRQRAQAGFLVALPEPRMSGGDGLEQH